jgi:hypothetical protein
VGKMLDVAERTDRGSSDRRFESDIRISNEPFIDRDKLVASKPGR